MRKFSLAVVAGLLASVLSVGLAPAAGAAIGGTVETGFSYVQGAEADGQLVFAWTELFEGSVTTCLDLGCEQTTSALVPGLDRLSGYALVGNGAVLIGIDSDGDSVMLDCASPSCDSISGLRPAPQLGQAFAAPDGSLVIADRNTISTCSDISCASSTTDALPQSIDLAMDPRNGALVFLTGSEVVRCSTAACVNPEASSHGLTAVRAIDVEVNGRALITMASNFDDDAFTPQLARCANVLCTSSSIEALNERVSGRTKIPVVAGTVDRVVAWISAARRGTVITSPAACTKEANGTSVNLEFNGDVGRSAQLRVNGKWVRGVTGDSAATVEGAQASDNFVIRHWFGDESVDVVCEAATSPPAEPQPECVFSRDGSRVTLEFESNGQSANLRRNGTWIASVRGVTSYVDNNAPAGASYVLVRRVDGQKSSYNCVEVDSAACSLSAASDGVEIRWSNTGDNNVVLRKNQRWLASPTRDVSSYIDASGSAGDTYIARLWSDPNTFVDVACR